MWKFALPLLVVLLAFAHAGDDRASRMVPTGSFSKKSSFNADFSNAVKSKLSGSIKDLINRWLNPTCKNCTASLTNWGGNFQFQAKHIEYPRSTQEVVNIVKNSLGKVRAVGNRHSFSTIADTTDTLVSLSAMTSILGVNTDDLTITVQAGAKYTDVMPFLEFVTLALPAQSSLAEISIAGAMSTGAHGSGYTVQNLASQVVGMQMVLANGTVANFTRKNDKQMMQALGVGLGVGGIITEVTLQTEPRYDMQTFVFQKWV